MDPLCIPSLGNEHQMDGCKNKILESSAIGTMRSMPLLPARLCIDRHHMDAGKINMAFIDKEVLLYIDLEKAYDIACNRSYMVDLKEETYSL